MLGRGKSAGGAIKFKLIVDDEPERINILDMDKVMLDETKTA